MTLDLRALLGYAVLSAAASGVAQAFSDNMLEQALTTGAIVFVVAMLFDRFAPNVLMKPPR